MVTAAGCVKGAVRSAGGLNSHRVRPWGRRPDPHRAHAENAAELIVGQDAGSAPPRERPVRTPAIQLPRLRKQAVSGIGHQRHHLVGQRPAQQLQQRADLPRTRVSDRLPGRVREPAHLNGHLVGTRPRAVHLGIDAARVDLQMPDGASAGVGAAARQPVGEIEKDSRCAHRRCPQKLRAMGRPRS